MASPFTRVDFVLGEPGVIHGRVLWPEDRRPVVGAIVAAYPWRGHDAFQAEDTRYTWHQPPLVTARSSATGDYRLADMPPGRYQLRVLPEDGPQIQTHDAGILVESGRDILQDLVLGNVMHLCGRILDAGTGEPIAGAEVFVDPARTRHAITGPDGRWAIRNFERVPFGRTIRARAEGYFPAAGRSLGWDAFQLETEYNFKLHRAARVSGRVVGPAGPVVGARVSTDRRVGIVESGRNRSVLGVVTTDEQGRFECPVPSHRAFTIHAYMDGLGWASTGELDAGAAGSSSGVIIRLAEGGGVAGRVTKVSGDPVPGASVTLWEGWVPRLCVFSRADGAFEFDGVPPGSYEVSVVPPGMAERSRSPLSGAKIPVVVASGATVDVPVRLCPGPVIAGRVVDPAGFAVPGVVVTANPRSPNVGESKHPRLPLRRSDVTDELGFFRIEGLWSREQTYYVLAQSTTHEWALVENVCPGGPDITVTVAPYRTLRGRVVARSTRRPVTVFWLRPRRVQRPGDGESRGWFRYPYAFPPHAELGRYVDADGAFTLHVKPGTFELVAVTDDGLRSDTRTVVIPETGDPPLVEIKVWPSAALSGLVDTPDGLPPRSGQIMLSDLSGKPPRITNSSSLDDRGAFRISGLDPGRYLAYAQATDEDGTFLAGTSIVDLQVGVEPKIRVVLSTGVRVDVTVTGMDEKPVSGADVQVERMDRAPIPHRLSRTIAEVALIQSWRKEKVIFDRMEDAMAARKRHLARLNTTGPDGRLLPWMLLEGDYRLRVTAPGFAAVEKRFRITGTGPQPVTVQLVRE